MIAVASPAVDTPRRFPPGSLVRARGREWVVLPSPDRELLLLRPLGAPESDATGIVLALEGHDVDAATLALPDPAGAGDAETARLLRDAARLSLRHGTGPLRALGRIAVEPRPYQLVPLLMALRLDPVRLLIADDVGIGKTVEAGLIMRELLDRGEIGRLAVLCPPPLCEQWQRELRDKFHVPAEVVRPGTVAALERRLEREGEATLTRSIYEAYPFTVTSIDYIKSDRRRAEFLRACPECVIVDEAHGAARPGARGAAQQQRHDLVRELAADAQRHLILVTATPHSGDQEAFASLIGLLRPDLEEAVVQREFGARTRTREALARHFVQRRRDDIRQYLATATDFPKRESGEATYRLSDAYATLLRRVVAFTREYVRAPGATAYQRRVRYWAALALLRCVSSSPAAAAAALRTRARPPETGDEHEADRRGAAALLDLQESDAVDDDATPAADVEPDATAETGDTATRRRLLALANEAERLGGAADAKLARAAALVQELLASGFNPIVFCRYIATAQYVAVALERQRATLARAAGVRAEELGLACVTGELPAEAREERVIALTGYPRRVLVATDCLSEGVNLQQGFDAVLHYDLAWNPTRHDQREGRVDRYGQTRPVVRAVLLYGENNPVDGAVLKVMLRRAIAIRRDTGVAVPLPADAEKVLAAIFEELLLRDARPQQLRLFDLDDAGAALAGLDRVAGEQAAILDQLWDEAAGREHATRSIFSQAAIHEDLVAGELAAVREAVGSAAEAERLVTGAYARLTGVFPPRDDGAYRLELDPLPAALKLRLQEAAGGEPATLRLAFGPAPPAGAIGLSRTHPLVEAMAGYLLDTALDTPATAVAKRAGVMRTTAVNRRTAILLLRARYVIRERGAERELLAEEAFFAGLEGDYAAPEWRLPEQAAALAEQARAAANVTPEAAARELREALHHHDAWRARLDALVIARAQAALAAHLRVREAARARYGAGPRPEVEAKTPADLLGLYIYLPVPPGMGTGYGR